MNNPLAKLAEIKQLLSGKDPEMLYRELMQTNPQFAQFVQENKGKTIEQIAAAYGIDLNMLQTLLR